ncbi:HDIG domain-containing metalloprotein [Nanoarchaeota archaeon]
MLDFMPAEKRKAFLNFPFVGQFLRREINLRRFMQSMELYKADLLNIFSKAELEAVGLKIRGKDVAWPGGEVVEKEQSEKVEGSEGKETEGEETEREETEEAESGEDVEPEIEEPEHEEYIDIPTKGLAQFKEWIETGSAEDLEELSEQGLISTYIPEWERLRKDETGWQHGGHELKLDKHTLKLLKYLDASKGFRKLKEHDQRLLRVAALLHDIEKKGGSEAERKENKIKSDFDHPERGAETAKRILERLEYQTTDIRRIYRMIHYHNSIGNIVILGDLIDPHHDRRHKVKYSKSTLAHKFNVHDIEMLRVFTKADMYAFQGQEALDETTNYYAKVLGKPITTSKAVNMCTDEIKKLILKPEVPIYQVRSPTDYDEDFLREHKVKVDGRYEADKALKKVLSELSRRVDKILQKHYMHKTVVVNLEHDVHELRGKEEGMIPGTEVSVTRRPLMAEVFMKLYSKDVKDGDKLFAPPRVKAIAVLDMEKLEEKDGWVFKKDALKGIIMISLPFKNSQ